jgi:hypothetical protein
MQPSASTSLPQDQPPTNLPTAQDDGTVEIDSRGHSLAWATPKRPNSPPEITLEEACRIYDEFGCDPSIMQPLYNVDVSASKGPQSSSSAAVTSTAIASPTVASTGHSLSPVQETTAEGRGQRVEKRPRTDISDDTDTPQSKRRFTQKSIFPGEISKTSPLVAIGEGLLYAQSRAQFGPAMPLAAAMKSTMDHHAYHAYHPSAAESLGQSGRTASWSHLSSPEPHPYSTSTNPRPLTASDHLLPSPDYSQTTPTPPQTSSTQSWGNLKKDAGGDWHATVLSKAVYGAHGINVAPRPRPTHKKVHAVSGRLLTATTSLERRHLYQALYPSLIQLMSTLQQAESRSGGPQNQSYLLRLDCRYSEAYNIIAKAFDRAQQSVTGDEGPEPLFERAHPQEWIDYIEDWDMPYRGLDTADQRQQWLQQHWNSQMRDAEKSSVCPVILSKECEQYYKSSSSTGGGILGLGREIWIAYDPTGGRVVILGMK